MNGTAIEHTCIEATLREVAETVPGWSPFEQLLSLFTLAYHSARLGDVLEIGSWCGRSMIALGLAAQSAGSARVHCVDAFPERDDWYENADGTFSFQVATATGVVRGHVDQVVWAEPFHRDIVPTYERWGSLWKAFLASRERFGLTDIVTPHRMSSAAFFTGPGRAHRYGLVFIDGEHSYEAVSHDMDAAIERLVDGGTLCMDDAFTSYDGVTSAIRDRIEQRASRLRQPMRVTRKLFAAVKA
jgi:predicted O-methyltransferase YrrM